VSASFDITTTMPNMVFSCSEYSGTILPEQLHRVKVGNKRLVGLLIFQLYNNR